MPAVDLRKGSLWPYLLVYGTSILLFPTLPVFISSPMLVAALYKLSWTRFLWFSFISGTILDLFSTDFPLGFYGAVFLITGGMIGSLKRHFFSDHLTTLPLMTFFTSFLQGLIAVILSPIFDLAPRITPSWVLTDLFFMPIVDGGVAFLLFLIFPRIFRFRSGRRQEFFVGDSS